MQTNDARQSCRNITIGQDVHFRFKGQIHAGTVSRLTVTKAVIRSAGDAVHTVSYRQIVESDAYRPERRRNGVDPV